MPSRCPCGPLRPSRRSLPARLDTRLLFPGVRGGHLNLNEFRDDDWTPALKAAGLAHRGPYALRHTCAAFSIAAGVSLYELARFMGTSVEQIDRTYGHLLPDSIDRTRAAIDTFVSDSETKPPKVWAMISPRFERLVVAIAVGAPRFELGTSSPPD